MVLRAKQPEAVEKRLKLFVYGPAKVGKTTACIQFPSAYVIDTEKGAENKAYVDLMKKAGSVLFQSSDFDEVMSEVTALATEKHPYKTVIIDPITVLYNNLLESAERKVGTEFGRHYGEANKQMRRLVNMLLRLDMNVILTSHQKAEYGPNLVKLGETFDAWKKLDYLFDLILRLEKVGKNERQAVVAGSRITTFPQDDRFPFSYDELAKRYGAETMERQAVAVSLATKEQAEEAARLVALLKIDAETIAKWGTKAGADDWNEYPQEAIVKVIDYCKKQIEGAKPATKQKEVK